MVINFWPNFLKFVDIFSNTSKVLGKTFCRHITNVLCLLGEAVNKVNCVKNTPQRLKLYVI